jgi:hypothetical protein
VGPDTNIDLDKLRTDESRSLLLHLVALRNRLFASLDAAEEYNDGKMPRHVAGQLHRNLEIGDLAVGSTTVNNVLIAPQYISLRVELVKALAPFPEARFAVAQVLHGVAL